jgi:hypothetical protein
MSQPKKKTATRKRASKKTTKKVHSKGSPKKTAKRAVAAKLFTFEGPVFIEGVMHLSPMDLMKFELVQAKYANLAQAAVLKRNEMDEVQRTFTDKMHRLRQEASQLKVGVKDSGVALEQAKSELQEVYGIDLTKVIYDDQSGKVHVMQDDGEPIPLLEGVEPPAPPTPDIEK